MANPLRIYSGPGEISLYDATNGILRLGFNKEINVDGEAQSHELLDGNIHQYNTLYKLMAPLLQTDQSLIDSIKARRTTKQEITIIGFESAVRMRNVFVSFGLKRGFKAGEPHQLELQAQTAIEDDVFLIENLLGTDGSFEVAGGDANIGSGWTTTIAIGNRSRPASFLTGVCQQVQIGSGEYMRNEKRLVFEGQTRLTFSAWAKHISGPAEVQMRIDLIDDSDSIIATHTSDKVISGTPAGIAMTQAINPSAPVKAVRFEFRPTATGADVVVQLDNVQAEFGELTDFVENDL